MDNSNISYAEKKTESISAILVAYSSFQNLFRRDLRANMNEVIFLEIPMNSRFLTYTKIRRHWTVRTVPANSYIRS